MKLTKEDKAFLAEKYRTVWEDESMVEHCVKKTSAYVVLRDDKVLTFDKPTIKTDFWFGEHGFDYDEKIKLAHELSNDEAYFVEENINRCDAVRMLKALAEGDDVMVCQSCSGGDICHLRFYNHRDKVDGRELYPDELEEIVVVLEEEREKFRKRLVTYLKRYGLSKCRFDTFWADR